MKGTIVDAHIEGKATYVTKQTKYGTFTSKVVLHPEDEDIQSEVLGYTFAEIKCDIKALKAKMKYFEHRAIGISHALDVIVKSRKFEVFDPAIQALCRQKNVAWDEYYKARETYLINKDSYEPRVERMLQYRRKIKKSKM